VDESALANQKGRQIRGAAVPRGAAADVGAVAGVHVGTKPSKAEFWRNTRSWCLGHAGLWVASAWADHRRVRSAFRDARQRCAWCVAWTS
jgi:hypothetical protein